MKTQVKSYQWFAPVPCLKTGVLLLSLLVISSHCEASGFRFRKPSPLLNKGDIYVRTATRDVALAVGADGQILSADSSQPTGLKWTSNQATGTPAAPFNGVQFNNPLNSFGGDVSFTWNSDVNTLGISRDAGQTGYALIISSDTGAILANISHDGSALFSNLAGGILSVTQATTDNSTKIATTAFVSNAVTASNPAVAVQAATAAVLPNSPSYNNGVAGVGATLTSTSAAALVVDGYTVLLNDRVLVKNQATAANNGVYTQTTLGTGIINWVLTRATDYNTPSDMNNTGAIPVVNGTANTDTMWLQTSTVNNVGTDAVTFTQFSLNPTTLVTSAAALTNNAVIIGQGGQASATITADTSTTHMLFSTAGAPAFRQFLSSDIAAGVIAEAFGGTGIGTYTKGDIRGGNGTNTLGTLAIGSMGQMLSVDTGSALGFKWVASPSGSGSPGNPSTSFQYNSGGTFTGATLITTDGVRVAVGPGTSTLVSVDVAGNIRTVPIILTDSLRITPDASRSNFFVVTLAGAPRTLDAPTNGVFGERIIIDISQDATGSRKIGLGPGIKIGTDVPSFDASTTAGRNDYIGLIFQGNSWDVVAVSKGYA